MAHCDIVLMYRIACYLVMTCLHWFVLNLDTLTHSSKKCRYLWNIFTDLHFPFIFNSRMDLPTIFLFVKQLDVHLSQPTNVYALNENAWALTSPPALVYTNMFIQETSTDVCNILWIFYDCLFIQSELWSRDRQMERKWCKWAHLMHRCAQKW